MASAWCRSLVFRRSAEWLPACSGLLVGSGPARLALAGGRFESNAERFMMNSMKIDVVHPDTYS
jgi:hypothetical protein